jgi:LAO/AO transport system kinase
MMLDFAPRGDWRPPIIKTSATTGSGVAEVLAALEAHGDFLERSGQGERRRARRARARLLGLLEQRFRRTVEARAPGPDGLENAVRAVVARDEDPYAAAERLFRAVLEGTRPTAGRASP